MRGDPKGQGGPLPLRKNNFTKHVAGAGSPYCIYCRGGARIWSYAISWHASIQFSSRLQPQQPSHLPTVDQRQYWSMSDRTSSSGSQQALSAEILVRLLGHDVASRVLKLLLSYITTPSLYTLRYWLSQPKDIQPIKIFSGRHSGRLPGQTLSDLRKMLVKLKKTKVVMVKVVEVVVAAVLTVVILNWLLVSFWVHVKYYASYHIRSHPFIYMYVSQWLKWKITGIGRNWHLRFGSPVGDISHSTCPIKPAKQCKKHLQLSSNFARYKCSW